MNNGLYDVPGCSATWRAAARASWLALPATKPSKLNSGMRLERSACAGLGAGIRAARAAGTAALAGPEEPGAARGSETRIGQEKNFAPKASIRGGDPPLNPFLTKRLGASTPKS